MLAVYDCMLFLRAASRPQRVRREFELVREGAIRLCLSPPVLTEIRDVLTRPELVRKFPALTAHAVDFFLTDYLRLAEWFHNVPEVFHLVRDPKDSKYINLAAAANARYLVTTDNDLLDLTRSPTPEGKEFIRRFPNLLICDPRNFLTEVSPKH